MQTTGMTQSELSRISGVRQPSVSQYLSRRIQMSDDMLDRLLSCMGYRLDRSPSRSWRLHRQLSTHLSPETFREWRSTILCNIERLRGSTQGQPHVRNLDRWQQLVEGEDLTGLRRMMTGLDPDSVQMREVSPLGGLLPQDERSQMLELTQQ